MKKKKIKIWVIVLAGVLAAGTGGYFVYKKLTTKTLASSGKYLQYKVEKKNIELSVSATGTVAAVNTQDVISASSSTIVSLGVSQGAQVTEGATVATLDASSSKLDLDKAKANLDQSNLQLTQLKSSLNDTYVTSQYSGTITSVYISAGDNTSSLGSGQSAVYGEITLDKNQYGHMAGEKLSFPTPQGTNSGKITAVYAKVGVYVGKGTKLYKMSDSSIQQQIANQKISIQSAQNQYNSAKEAYDSCIVKAPITGIVSVLNYKTGDTVQNGKAIATITDLTKLQVVVPVDELDISKVKLNQACDVLVDALSNKTYTGKVTNVANIGTASNNVTTYDVTVTLDNIESVKIGMTANVTIVVSSKTDALVVPLEAVTTKNGKSYVMTSLPTGATAAATGAKIRFTGGSGSGTENTSTQGSTNSSAAGRQGGSSSLTEVTLGVQNETEAEIVSGLTEGQTVYVKEAASTTTTSTSTSKAKSGFGGMGGLTGNTNKRPEN